MDDFLGAEVPKAALRPPSIAPPHRIPERLRQRRESDVVPPPVKIGGVPERVDIVGARNPKVTPARRADSVCRRGTSSRLDAADDERLVTLGLGSSG